MLSFDRNASLTKLPMMMAMMMAGTSDSSRSDRSAADRERFAETPAASSF